MKAQKDKTRKRSLQNVKQGAAIKFLVHSKGYKLQTIADELNISRNAVSRAIYGLSKISRVNDWLVNHGILNKGGIL